MPTWNEQIQQIQKLRLTHRELGEQLYATKVNLDKVENILRKVRRQETAVPVDREDIDVLRVKISTLETSLLGLKTNDADIAAQLKEKDELTSFIEKKVQAVSGQIDEVNRQLTEEQNNRQPDREKIRDLQIQLEKLQSLIRELNVDLEKAKKDQAALLRQQREAQTEKEKINKRRSEIKGDITKLQQELDSAMRVGEQNEAELEQKKKELEGNKNRLKETLDTSTSDLHLAVESIYVDPHPRNPLSNLNDSIPFLLLPVRIETRFVTTDALAELWLRVYPDDIAVHTHEKTLTDREVAEGKKYWIAIFDAEKNGGEEKEDQKKDAWSALASLFGSQRAAWIARETKPLNWSEDLTGIDTHEDLAFPPHDLTTSSAWSRAPRTHVMPDKFVVMLYEGETIVKEATGNIIRDELFVGPDPLEPDESFVTLEDEQRLALGEAYNWTSNFDKAVEYGMGFKIPLTPAQASRGFDKILVLGTYLSADEVESQKAVETLIDNHHYSPKGFSIIRQGTATNNTDQEGSGYTKNDAFNNVSYVVEADEPLFTAADNCDGKDLADALGIDYEPLQNILNSNGTDHKDAVAMNTALYPSTLGYFFDTLMKPVLDDSSQDKLRNFFIDHVSGRGPLPAIRVGDQPYGVLLTSDFSKWQWGRNEPVWGVTFLNTIYKAIDHYRGIWKSLLNDVMYIGKPDTNHSEVLMNILGMQAGSVSFFQRTAYSTDDLINRSGFKFGEAYFADLLNSMVSKNVLLNFLNSFGYNIRGTDGQLKIPQLLRLVFQHYHTLLDAANLIDNAPLSEKDGIKEYAAGKNYIHWLLETETIAALEKQDFGEGIKAPTSLLYMQLRRSLLLQLGRASVKWFGKNNINLDQVLAPTNFYNIRPGGNVTKWEVMKAAVGNALPDHPQKAMAVAEYLLTAGNNEDEAAFLNKIKESLQFLADKPTANLERCFTEHLDTCTYRLDAWESALFHQRLQKQRQVINADGQQQRREGVYLGAYGWLENIRPDNKRRVVRDLPESLRPLNNEPVHEYADNGGFVHAPSINHASAATVLRNGYLTHASADRPDAMAVNLSSERVRRALFILQGIRNGQTLEALLGYQFERGLHDRGSQHDSLKKLNEYIYDFRDAFKMEQHFVQQEGTDTVTETIPANNVVNGVKLAETALSFPYGATGPVTAASTDEKAAIEEEKDKLDDTLDAIKDLLLSESVYQTVLGNADRTGAVMNALKDAHIPPELEVINTPRSSHFSFTNRVTVQFEALKPGDADYNPWPAIAMTPRAVMEPGINKWLKRIIGEPENLLCLVSHKDADGEEFTEEITVGQLNIQPVDLIYMIGNELNTGAGQPGKENRTAASELESRIAFCYRKMKSLDDETPVTIEFLKPENGADKKTLGSMLPLLRMLKSLITDSRSLHAEDFDPPSKTSAADKNNPKGYDHAELLERVQQALSVFQNYINDLGNLPVRLNEVVGSVTGDVTLQDFFNALNDSDSTISDVDVSFSDASAFQLQQVLVRIAAFGMADAFPKLSSVENDDKKLVLLEQGQDVFRRMMIMSETANTLITDATSPANSIEKKVARLTEAGKALFGDVFNILVLFTYNNVQDVQLSNGDRGQLLKYATDTLKMDFVADEWLQSVSHVRPRLAKWEGVRALYESLHVASPGNDQLELYPVQLPYRSKDSWIAVEFPSTDEDDEPFNITHDTLSVTVHGDASSSFTANSQCGILVDEWTEIIPVKEEITGIGFNYNQPDAAPPQTLLLAVTPVEKGSWDWDALVGILNDTLLRAKLRAIEPALLDKVDKPETGVLLPALLASFSQYDLDIALDYRMNVDFLEEKIPIVAATTVTG